MKVWSTFLRSFWMKQVDFIGFWQVFRAQQTEKELPFPRLALAFWSLNSTGKLLALR